MDRSHKNAFVLMPFSEPYDSYYPHIFKPALEAAGFRVSRADDLFSPTPIITDIQQSIVDSDILLCEMSERNPNVFYELGMGHAIGRPAILVSRDKGDIPFDLRHIRHIIYDTEQAMWKEHLHEDIKKAALSLLNVTNVYPQPLLTEKPFIVKENEYEARQFLINFLLKNPQMQVDMLEYSTTTATELLHVLRQTECKIRLLVQHPRTACSVFQRERINASIKDLCLRIFRDYRDVEIRFYCTPGSLRGRNFGCRLLHLGWYTYGLSSQEGVNIHGDTNSQIILRTDGARGQTLLNMFKHTFEGLWRSEHTIKPGPMPWMWPLKIPSPKVVIPGRRNPRGGSS